MSPAKKPTPLAKMKPTERNKWYNNFVPNYLSVKKDRATIEKRMRIAWRLREAHFEKLSKGNKFFKRLLSIRKTVFVPTQTGAKQYQILMNGLSEKTSGLKFIVVLDEWGRTIMFRAKQPGEINQENPHKWVPFIGVNAGDFKILPFRGFASVQAQMDYLSMELETQESKLKFHDCTVEQLAKIKEKI